MSNLSKALELVSQAGQLVATDGMESGSKESDSFFEALAGLILAKKALTTLKNERNAEQFDELARKLNAGWHEEHTSGTGPKWYRDAVEAEERAGRNEYRPWKDEAAVRQFNELLFGDRVYDGPIDTGNRGQVSGASGLDGRDEGAVQMPGATQAQDQKPPQ